MSNIRNGHDKDDFRNFILVPLIEVHFMREHLVISLD